MTDRKVTEADFRLPQFRDANPADYEFRADGQLVRKDRWETAVCSIWFLISKGDRREFETTDVVKSVSAMVDEQASWIPFADMDKEDRPSAGQWWDIQLKDGSVLKAAARRDGGSWIWHGGEYRDAEVIACREQAPVRPGGAS